MEKLEDRVLRKVEKPIRYTGGEMNSYVKDKNAVDVRFAFCFPDVYEIGMSHLGMKILYSMLNEREDTWCERVFAPWNDYEQKMREEQILLYGLESKDAIKEFDFVGFTLQYELSDTNILNMLDLAKIPIFSALRTEEDPIVCAGGPCAYNPEPLAEFIDFFSIGESEEQLNEVIDLYKTTKTRKEFLEKVANIEGIYVPSLKNETTKVKKRIIKDFDHVYYPEKFIVPLGDSVHDRATLEIFRGCMRGCRFCEAGYIYRPVREKSVETLLESAEKIIEHTGYEEISLASLSTSDYRKFDEFAKELIPKMKEKRVNLSLPSLRVDSIQLELLKQVQTVRKSGITIAPEAGSQRLRDVINKGLSEEEILNSCRLVFESRLEYD